MGGEIRMISADLLNELKKSDPELWEKFIEFYWIEEQLESVEYDCDEWGHKEIARVPDNYHNAILQAYIQEEIRARGWFFQLVSHGEEYVADITVFNPIYDIIDGDWAKSSVEALLRAYLQAVNSI